MDVKDFCTGLQHIGIPTLDINKTIKFYLSLGFEVVYQRTNDNGQHVAFLQFGNLQIETYDKEPAAMQAGSFEHIAIDVKNIEGLYEVVKSKGFHICDSPIHELPYWERGIKYFKIEGPNKETIEFCEKL